MALVMLPCDLPWWPAVVKQLDKVALAKNSEDLIDAMQRLHDMCKYDLCFQSLLSNIYALIFTLNIYII